MTVPAATVRLTGDGPESRIARIMPVIREHGAAVVALTIDERGQARTAPGKVEVAERLTWSRPWNQSRGMVRRLAIGTAGRVPSWPTDDHRRRLLVEVPGGRWRGEAAARRAGFDVVTCPGPRRGWRAGSRRTRRAAPPGES